MYKNVDEAMSNLAEWKKCRKEKVEPRVKNMAYRPTFNAECFREAAFCRFYELAESTFELYTLNFLVGAGVTARSAQETIAAIWFINSKLEHLTKTKDLSHFVQSMKRLSLGWSSVEGFPEKNNVLKYIDSVDKIMDGRFRQHYNMLSEYAHPNYSGMLGVYSQANHETLEVTFGFNPHGQRVLKNHIESTLMICIGLLRPIQEGYEKIINEALKVCLELHEQGRLKEQFYNQI